MKIVYLAAGAGGMYCGSCLHDNTLAAALLALGEDGESAPDGPDAYIIALDEESCRAGLSIAKQARQAGLSVAIDFSGKSLKKQMTAADKAKAGYAIIIGGDELLTGSLTVRDMTTGEQRGVDTESLIDVLSGHE